MAHNFGEVVHLVPSHSRSSSVSSAYSHSSSSNYSEASYIFGENDFGYGAFPSTADGEYGSFPSAAPVSRSAIKKPVAVVPSRGRESILQKSAMHAFIASPSSSRWSDLVVSHITNVEYLKYSRALPNS